MTNYEILDGAIALTGQYINSEKKNERLYIVYNPQLTSIKINQNTAITPTIGAKYPLYRKNAMTNYRSFSLGGLITFESQFDERTYWDENKREFVTENLRDSHLSEEELLPNSEKLGSDPEYDYSFELERRFREKIIEFLTDGKPKLFDSEQEGKMLVVLTDVTLSPNQQLGRKYSMISATVTEIGDTDNDTLNKYNLLPYEKVEQDLNELR